jgi:intracellular septation protein
MTDPMTDDPRQDTPAPSPEKAGLKLLIELGPLVVFLATLVIYGIKPATMVLMAGSVLSIIASKLFLGHVGTMPYVTAAIVWLAGSLTLYFDDSSFIKMKPTIANILFAGALGYGLATGRLFIKMLFGEAFNLTEAGWRKLTIRWIGFFLVVAALNEIVWRTSSDSTWGMFKVAIIPLTFVFAAAQLGLINTHSAKPKSEQNV